MKGIKSMLCTSDKLYIIRATEDKLLSKLSEAEDPNDIAGLLQIIGMTRQMLETVYYGDEKAFSDDPEIALKRTGAEEEKKEEPKQEAPAAEEKPTLAQIEVKPVEAPSVTTPDKPEYSKELFLETRKKLATSGAAIADILNEIGYKKLSEVPQELYPALLQKAGVE